MARAEFPVIVFNDFILWVRNNYPKSVCRRASKFLKHLKFLKHPLPTYNPPFSVKNVAKYYVRRVWRFLPTIWWNVRFNVVWLSFSWEVQLSFFFFFKQLYNLINFPQIPVSYDTGIILLKVKEFEAEWLMMKWERKKNAYATSDNWCGHSIKETQLALLFEWVPWCYLQSVLKVSGNPEKQAITGDVGRLRKENVIYMISFSIFLWSSFFFLNFSML